MEEIRSIPKSNDRIAMSIDKSHFLTCRELEDFFETATLLTQVQIPH